MFAVPVAPLSRIGRVPAGAKFFHWLRLHNARFIKILHPALFHQVGNIQFSCSIAQAADDLKSRNLSWAPDTEPGQSEWDGLFCPELRLFLIARRWDTGPLS